MKRLFSFIIPVLFLTQNYAQDQLDALRYSQTYPGGTARSVAMGGAFGSLGADFYSATQNPAGLGMYRGSELTITPELYYSSINSRYYGTEVNDSKYNFNLSNLGYVKSFQKNESGFIGATIAFGFNRINNFNLNTATNGINYYNSMAQSMAESADIKYWDNQGTDPFSEELFYDGYLIHLDELGYYSEPDIDISLDSLGSGIKQKQNFGSSGRMNEWVFSAGFNYNHVLYFGGTFSLVSVVYKEDVGYNEFDGVDSEYEFFYYNNTMETSGIGVSGKFGMIVRPLPFFRIGMAYHLPVSYSLTMEYNAYLQSRYTDPAWIDIRPNDESGNYFEYGESKFKVVSPGKTIGSVSFTLGQFAMLAVDVEYIDYTKMKLKDTYSEYPEDANEVINSTYNSAWNVKTGAEVRLNKLYLRGGFNYLQSPYAEGEMNESADQYIITTGIGIRNKNFFIDFTYAYQFNDERSILYAYQTRYNTANYDIAKSRFMMTLGIKL